MRNTRKITILFIINFIVFFGLIGTLDFLSITFTKSRDLIFKKQNGQQDSFYSIPDMPIFAGVPWIKEYISDATNLHMDFSSFTGWRRNKFKSGTINIDSLGIRHSTRHPATSASSLKTAFLGGSTIWGTCAIDSLTIPSIFNHLGAGKYDAVNLGETSYNAYQSHQFLQIRVINGYRPEVIISYDGVNNTPGMLPAPFSHHRESQINELLKGADRPKHVPSYGDYFLKPTIGLLRKVSHRVFGKVDFQEVEDNASVIKKSPMSDEEAARFLLESWLLTKTLADQMNARYYCILQPNVYVGKPKIGHLTNLAPFSYRYYDHVRSRIDSSSRYAALKDCFIDMTSAFDNLDDIYFDFCHVMPAGNVIIAKRIMEHIEKKQIQSN